MSETQTNNVSPYCYYIFAKPPKTKQKPPNDKIKTEGKKNAEKYQINILDQLLQQQNKAKISEKDEPKNKKIGNISQNHDDEDVSFNLNMANRQQKYLVNISKETQVMKKIGLNLQPWSEVEHIPELSTQQPKLINPSQPHPQSVQQLWTKSITISNINLTFTLNHQTNPKYLYIRLVSNPSNYLSTYSAKLWQNNLSEDLNILFHNNIDGIYQKLASCQFNLNVSSKQIVFLSEQLVSGGDQTNHSGKKTKFKIYASIKLQQLFNKQLHQISNNENQDKNNFNEFKKQKCHQNSVIRQQKNGKVECIDQKQQKQKSSEKVQKQQNKKKEKVQKLLNSAFLDNQLNQVESSINSESESQSEEQQHDHSEIKAKQLKNPKEGKVSILKQQINKYQQLSNRIIQQQKRVTSLRSQLSSLKQKSNNQTISINRPSITQLNPVLQKQHIKMITEAKKLIQGMRLIQLNMITAQNHHDCNDKISQIKLMVEELHHELERYTQRMVKVENYLVYDLKNQLDYIYNELKMQKSFNFDDPPNQTHHKGTEISMEKEGKKTNHSHNKINYGQYVEQLPQQFTPQMLQYQEENSFGPVTQQLCYNIRKWEDQGWESYNSVPYSQFGNMKKMIREEFDDNQSEEQMMRQGRHRHRFQQKQKQKKKKKYRNGRDELQKNQSYNSEINEKCTGYNPWKNRTKTSNQQQQKLIMAQLFPQAEQKIQFVPPKILKKNQVGFQIRGKNIRYRSINVWGQLVGDQISLDTPQQNQFHYKFMKTKYTNANIGIGIVDLQSQLNPQILYPTCIFYLGGGAQVWVGDPKKSRFVKTPGTAFKEGDIVTMTVDLQQGDIAWYINQKLNMKLEQNRMLKDQRYRWATYLLMMNNDDEIQML